MSEEEKIQQDLTAKFAYLKDAVTIRRERRIFLDVTEENFLDVFKYLVNEMNFSFLSAITGMDEVSAIAIVYHLSREGKIILSLRIRTARDNPKIKTITNYFPSADAYERELTDLLGIEVEGLAPGHRYPLPDNWPGGCPLRKDWKGDNLIKEVPNA